MPNAYQRIPTREPSPPAEEEPQYLSAQEDPRFKIPTPPTYQRVLLVLFVIALHILAWRLIPVGTKPVEETDDP